jgi:hypothetical protein
MTTLSARLLLREHGTNPPVSPRGLFSKTSLLLLKEEEMREKERELFQREQSKERGGMLSFEEEEDIESLSLTLGLPLLSRSPFAFAPASPRLLRLRSCPGADLGRISPSVGANPGRKRGEEARREPGRHGFEKENDVTKTTAIEVFSFPSIFLSSFLTGQVVQRRRLRRQRRQQRVVRDPVRHRTGRLGGIACVRRWPPRRKRERKNEEKREGSCNNNNKPFFSLGEGKKMEKNSFAFSSSFSNPETSKKNAQRITPNLIQ